MSVRAVGGLILGLVCGAAIGACTVYTPGPRYVPPPAYPPPGYYRSPPAQPGYQQPPSGFGPQTGYPPQADPNAYPPQPGPPAASEARSERIQDERGRSVTLEHGASGDPAVIGCADGHREAFLDIAQYPRIAGCLGTWAGRQSLRAPPTGRPCGDEIGPCMTPADVCAPGWHVCGSSGAVADLRQVSADACEHAGGGRFAAAISHCKSQSGCEVDTRPAANYACYAQGWCSEPVCCGQNCGEFGSCRSGVWPDRTHIPFGQDQGCGSTASGRAGGILCCL